MRDKNRIPKILKDLERIWKANPDLRLGQLLVIGTMPKQPCPEVFYIEDDELLEGLLNFENGIIPPAENHVIPDWRKYTNVSRPDPSELTAEWLTELIMEIKEAGKNIVITPINLMKLNGAPVSDQTWLLSQKKRVKKLKKLLNELKDNGILKERKSKQDFLGIKEVGYDII